TGGGSAKAGVSHAGHADEVAGRDSGRHPHRERLGLGATTVASARLARIAEDLAFPFAPRTRRYVHELTEERLLHAPALTATGAWRAGRLAGAAAAVAGRAGTLVLDAEVLLDAGGDLFERELEPDLEIIAAPVVSAAAAAAKQVLEAAHVPAEVAHERPERVGQVEAAEIGAAVGHALSDAGVPEAVVARALLGVAQHFVRLGR